MPNNYEPPATLVNLPKIHVVGGDLSYMSWMEGIHTKFIEEADIAVFTGGTDVDPELYGQKPHPMTQSPDKKRDAFERRCFEYCVDKKIRMVGICRGAQFLCVMAGGTLVQHQDNSQSYHKIITERHPGSIFVTSDHHQAMFPWGLKKNEEFKPLGWTFGLSKFHYGETDGIEIVDHYKQVGDKLEFQTEGMEVEICYFPKIKALGIQSHPEWMHPKRGEYSEASKSNDHMQSLMRSLRYDTL